MAGGKVLSHHKADTWKLHHLLFANQLLLQSVIHSGLFMQPEHHLGKKIAHQGMLSRCWWKKSGTTSDTDKRVRNESDKLLT